MKERAIIFPLEYKNLEKYEFLFSIRQMVVNINHITVKNYKCSD